MDQYKCPQGDHTANEPGMCPTHNEPLVKVEGDSVEKEGTAPEADMPQE